MKFLDLNGPWDHGPLYSYLKMSHWSARLQIPESEGAVGDHSLPVPFGGRPMGGEDWVAGARIGATMGKRNRIIPASEYFNSSFSGWVGYGKSRVSVSGSSVPGGNYSVEKNMMGNGLSTRYLNLGGRSVTKLAFYPFSYGFFLPRLVPGMKYRFVWVEEKVAEIEFGAGDGDDDEVVDVPWVPWADKTYYAYEFRAKTWYKYLWAGGDPPYSGVSDLVWKASPRPGMGNEGEGYAVTGVGLEPVSGAGGGYGWSGALFPVTLV
jgi:hypothetical protein